MEKHDHAWTFFHRSGSYTADYTPIWQRYLCYGVHIAAVSKVAADNDGSRKNGLTLTLSDYGTRLVNEDGVTVCWEETEIGPGDLVAVGTVAEPVHGCYRIRSVTAQGGLGMARGYVLVAE